MRISHDPHAPNSFRLLTFGGAALVDSAGAVVGEQRRRLGLLALLAAAGERGVSRDVLVSLLSPESPTDSARHALHQLLYYLRQQAGDHVFLGTDTLRLNPTVISTDLGDFAAALERGALEDAVALYRGPFLEGFHLGDSVEFEEWATAERSRLDARYADALARLAAEADAAGERTRAIEWWQRLVALDPLCGRAVVGLMEALSAAGDSPGALRQGRAHQARLRAELGIEVDAQMAELTARLEQAGRRISTPDVTRPEPRPAVESAEDRSAEPAPPPGRRRLLLAAALGATLTVGVVAVLGLTRSAGAPVAPTAAAVAVLPFRVESADSSFAWLGEGMVELLTIRLAGEGGIGVVDPGRVLPAWRRAAASGRSTAEDPLPRIAAEIGAERIIQGSVVGTTRHVVLSASIHSMSEGRDGARAVAEGPPDSIPILIDRLAAQLLGLGAGVERFRLASLTSASFPAIRAFLVGRAALRRGRSEQAVQEFREALTLDSTFALAGLELFRSWSATDADGARGWHLAWAGRDRLSGPDRALLEAMTGQFQDGQDLFRKWRIAVSAYPDRPETWYGLGDSYFHWGTLAGLDEPLRRAEDAFRRGWELDSSITGGEPAAGPLVVEPLLHLVELAHMRGDTMEVRRLVAYLLAADSSNDRARAAQWHRAAMDGPAARRAFWGALGAGGSGTLFEIANFIVWTGTGAEDYPEATLRSMHRMRAVEVGHSPLLLMVNAYNSGRHDELQEAKGFSGNVGHAALRDRLRWALWWDGDTSRAVEAARELRLSADGPLVSGRALRSQYADVCALGLWRAGHAEFAAAKSAGDRLRAAHMAGLHGDDSASAEHYPELCAALIDASRASGQSWPDALASITLADSLARDFIFEVCCNEAITETNLLLARLWERQGDLPRALQAVRRRSGGFMLAPVFLSTFLREEGRLAQATGDRPGAIRAYRHYLVLRSDSDRALRPQRDSVRAELHRLERAAAMGAPSS